MQTLTKAEEEIMLILWQLKKAFVKDILEQMPEPKPHYNTVSTTVRILQEKGYVDYEAFGKTHRYYPLLEKEAYGKRSVKQFLSGYFEGSAKQLVSFFVKEKNISVTELENLLKELKKQPKK